MANSQLEDMQELLRKAKMLPEIIEPEKSIFSIGDRGHWENPTTEILAFFCDNNAVHGLGDLVLKSLIQCLDTKYHNLDFSLNKPPEREVRTQSGKRIDLLLESERWVIVLENKIFHVQNNPFTEYEEFVMQGTRRFFNDKEAIFVVLSPDGMVTGASDKWKGISYECLIGKIKQHLSEHFINHPLNKWVVLLREFILHLEGLLMSKSNTVEDENIEFILKNIDSIKKLQELKTAAIKQWHESLRAQLESRMDKKIKITLEDWDGGLPALRFSCENWIDNDNDVVLFLSGNNNEHTILYYALLDSKDEHIMKQADDALFIDCSDAPWMEGKYRAYQCKYDSYDNVVDELYKKLKLLDNFYYEKN